MSFNKQLLDEFILNCQQRDLIKARLVLSHCDRIDLSSQKRILYELNKCDDEFALPLMLFISHQHADARSKFPMLAESIRERTSRSPDVIRKLLQTTGSEQAGYVSIAGDMELREAVPWLIGMLASEPRLEIQERIIHALGEMRAESAVDALTNHLDSDNEAIVDGAVDALGEIASTDAIKSLNQLLTSRSAHVRNRAKYQLIAIAGPAAEIVAENLTNRNADLLIHSLNILEAVGHQSSVAPVRLLINSNPPDANVRFAAYEALAQLPLRKGDYVLAAGLTDPDSAIRLAAARAVNEHLDKSLLGGINNMLDAADRDSERTARAIIDAHAGVLGMQLMNNVFLGGFSLST